MCFKKTLLLLAAVLAMPSFAESDFGVWTGVALEKEFGKKFSLDAGIDFRAAENVTRPARWSASFGAGYKVNKHLKFGAGYIFITDRNPWEYKVNYNEKGEMKGGGWCPSSLQGKKIHSLLSSALFWPGSISRAGHDLKLKTLVIIGI